MVREMLETPGLELCFDNAMIQRFSRSVATAMLQR